MGKRKNQPLIDSDTDSNNDTSSDFDSVILFYNVIKEFQE